jgi:site-specific recombinase XerD
LPLPDFLIKKLQGQVKTIPTNQRLWPWCRTKAWQEVKSAMSSAQTKGPRATAKGLRHGFAIAALQAGVPLNMVSKWLGHSSLEITAIYSNAFGQEERNLAKLLWQAK